MCLQIVELIMCIEEEFDIEIPDSDAEKHVTAGVLCDYIVQKSDAPGDQQDEIWRLTRDLISYQFLFHERRSAANRILSKI